MFMPAAAHQVSWRLPQQSGSQAGNGVISWLTLPTDLILLSQLRSQLSLLMWGYPKVQFQDVLVFENVQKTP
jgi:hypothetical protein